MQRFFQLVFQITNFESHGAGSIQYGDADHDQVQTLTRRRLIMRPQSMDTPLDVEERLIERYRQMTGLERLALALDMSEAVRQLALAGIRARHGSNLSEREECLRLAALTIDRETMIKAFGMRFEGTLNSACSSAT